MWDELAIDPTHDPKTIRRAYATRLKTIDPDRDLQAFTRLRAALDQALTEAEHASTTGHRPLPTPLPRPHPTSDEHIASDAPDFPIDVKSSDMLNGNVRPVDHRPADAADANDAPPDWIAARAADHALLDELDRALIGCDAPAAVKLYCRAAATGAVPLRGEPRLLERVLSLALDDKTIDDAAFREFVRAFGCDQSNFRSAQSEIHKDVLARLAAADWYETRLAIADRRKGETRRQARLARLVLGRIGRFWMPRVDRAILKSCLVEYRSHERWLSDRVKPAWIRRLEARLRRREILATILYMVLLGGFLTNGVVQFAIEAVKGTLPIAMLPLALVFIAFLVWVLKSGVKKLSGLRRPPPVASNQAPPDDLDARLRWLEQQAELAYEAMYHAPAGAALAAHYNDAKEFLFDAIALARRLGKAETVEHLSRRFDEIKAVFRMQFPG